MVVIQHIHRIIQIIRTFFKLNYFIRLIIYLLLYAIYLIIITPLPPPIYSSYPSSYPSSYHQPQRHDENLGVILSLAKQTKIKYKKAIQEPIFDRLISNVRNMNEMPDFWTDYPGLRGYEMIVGYLMFGRLYLFAENYHFFSKLNAQHAQQQQQQRQNSYSPSKNNHYMFNKSQINNNTNSNSKKQPSSPSLSSQQQPVEETHHPTFSQLLHSVFWFLINVTFVPDYYFIFFSAWYKGYLFTNVFLCSYHTAISVFMIWFNILCLLSGDWFWEHSRSQTHERNRRQQRVQEDRQLTILVRDMLLPELNNLHASINQLRSPADYTRMNVNQLVSNELELQDQLDMIRYELVNRSTTGDANLDTSNNQGNSAGSADGSNENSSSSIWAMMNNYRRNSNGHNSSSVIHSSPSSIVGRERRNSLRFHTCDRCVICLDRKPDIYLKTCYHACMCRFCALNHNLNGRTSLSSQGELSSRFSFNTIGQTQVKEEEDGGDQGGGEAEEMDAYWRQMIDSYEDESDEICNNIDNNNGLLAVDSDNEDTHEDDSDDAIRFYNPHAKLKPDLTKCPMCNTTIRGWGYCYKRASPLISSSNPYGTTTTAIELSKLTKYITSNPTIIRRLRYWSTTQ